MALQSLSSFATSLEGRWTRFHIWSFDVHAGLSVGVDVPRGTIFVAEALGIAQHHPGLETGWCMFLAHWVMGMRLGG
jgi:hypothetical protein